jgi:MerR family mercuric resistance operon transcriptional regulator
VNTSEIADKAGVPTATVRYHERRGLLETPRRTRAGYRQYESATGERLRFIKYAQELGFSLEEIRDLLDLRIDDPAACPRVAKTAREKIEGIEQCVRALQRMQRVLGELVDACDSSRATVGCPILTTIAESDYEEREP